MNAINNSGFLNLFAVTLLNGFAPSVAYVYDPAAHTITITDNTTYAIGDAIKLVHIHVTDKMGGQVYNKVTVHGGGGAVAVDVAALNAIEGFNVNCTVVSNLGALGDLSAYAVGATSPISGNLAYVNKQLA